MLLSTLMPGIRMDAADNRFFLRQLENIDQDVEKELYPEILYPKYIPTEENFDRGAASAVYRMLKQHGEAILVSDKSQSIPLVNVSGQEASAIVLPVASGYSLSQMEILGAEKNGVPLEREDAILAGETIERKLEYIAALGDTVLGIEGLCNADTVVTDADAALNAAGTSRTWALKTAEEMLTDLNAGVKGVMDQSLNVESPDSILLPPESYTLIAQKRVPETTATVLEWFKNSNPWVKDIGPWHYCNEAAGASTKRAVFYKRDKSRVKFKIPCGLITLPAQAKSLAVEVYMFKTTSGLELRKPGSMYYIDGI